MYCIKLLKTNKYLVLFVFLCYNLNYFVNEGEMNFFNGRNRFKRII